MRGHVIGPLVVLAVLAAVGSLVAYRLMEDDGPPQQRFGGPSVAPVEVGPITRGSIEQQRRFSATLEASARVTVAPKVAGRVVSIPFEMSQPVTNGEVVARLDAEEFEQAVAQAEADLAVAEAALVEAESAAELTQTELAQLEELLTRGVASDFEVAQMRADYKAKTAAVRGAEAQIIRAEAALESARLRLGDTRIRAQWDTGDDSRLVAERLIDPGDTIGANTPLLELVEIDPILAVIFATERDYAMLVPGQEVTLRTDAFPGRAWTGAVIRVAPVFREGSRQARVEIQIENPDASLRPGMFARVDATLGRADQAWLVPTRAISTRNGRDVIFVVLRGGDTATMRPVTLGIEGSELTQILTDEPFEAGAMVVTLGQQLLGESTEVSYGQSDDSNDDAVTAVEAREQGARP